MKEALLNGRKLLQKIGTKATAAAASSKTSSEPPRDARAPTAPPPHKMNSEHFSFSTSYHSVSHTPLSCLPLHRICLSFINPGSFFLFRISSLAQLSTKFSSFFNSSFLRTFDSSNFMFSPTNHSLKPPTPITSRVPILPPPPRPLETTKSPLLQPPLKPPTEIDILFKAALPSFTLLNVHSQCHVVKVMKT